MSDSLWPWDCSLQGPCVHGTFQNKNLLVVLILLGTSHELQTFEPGFSFLHLTAHCWVQGLCVNLMAWFSFQYILSCILKIFYVLVLLLPKSYLSVHQCQTEIRRQSYGGEGRIALLLLPGEEGTVGLVPPELCLLWWRRERLYSQAGVCDKDLKAITVLYSFYFCKFKGWGSWQIGCVEGLRWSSVLTLTSVVLCHDVLLCCSSLMNSMMPFRSWRLNSCVYKVGD